MEDQCLNCYFVSDRSTPRKSIMICDHTLHFEYYAHDIVREIPKTYHCAFFSAEKKPMIPPTKTRKPYTKKGKQC